MGNCYDVVDSGPVGSRLESDLRASVYHQMAISLLKALVKHGSHHAECSYNPCNCGWDSEVKVLIARSRAQGLKLVKGGKNEAA